MGAAAIPAEGAMLCEGCGYILDGLPNGARCPECAKPMEESRAGLRRPPAWEERGAFWATTAEVIFRPNRFFRSLNTRGALKRSSGFGRRHMLLTTALLAITAWLQLSWIDLTPISRRSDQLWLGMIIEIGLIGGATFVVLILTTRLAGWSTAWEAGYRGLRLPRGVVDRGLHYHSAHYLPVALMAFVTVAGFRLLMWHDPYYALWGTWYIYVLAGEVFVAAAYLFKTYWIGMKNMMFANA
jgi:hypothetical protein